MTIDEAIERTRNKAKLMQSNQSRKEWLQMAEWLEELKTLRYCKDKWNENQYQKGRADAIEGCMKIVKFHENEWDGINWAIKDIEELMEKKNE